VNFYGVAQGTAGGTGTYTTETWIDTALDASNLYGDLPGLLATDNDPSTQNINIGSVTYLGQLVIPASTSEGNTVSFEDAALTAFLQAYAGGSHQVTLVLAAGNGSGGQWSFASREATQTASGAVSGSVGDFAPYLEFEILGTAEPPSLNYQMTGDGSGIQFNWLGNFKLQYQTNSLQTGLGPNWMDYPSTNSPVTVPIEMSTPSAWYRLAPLQ
jgi:hypothetical protein